MGKLTIECLQKRIKLTDIADAVYKTLNQQDNLKAELVFTDANGIRALNKDTRGVDKVTDVLSYPSLDGIRGKIIKKQDFPLETERGRVFIGSIVLCMQKIKEQAKEIGHGEDVETQYLIVHGLMHLFGYDHMKDSDKAQMREKEKQALKLLGVEQ